MSGRKNANDEGRNADMYKITKCCHHRLKILTRNHFIAFYDFS